MDVQVLPPSALGWLRVLSSLQSIAGCDNGEHQIQHYAQLGRYPYEVRRTAPVDRRKLQISELVQQIAFLYSMKMDCCLTHCTPKSRGQVERLLRVIVPEAQVRSAVALSAAAGSVGRFPMPAPAPSHDGTLDQIAELAAVKEKLEALELSDGNLHDKVGDAAHRSKEETVVLATLVRSTGHAVHP